MKKPPFVFKESERSAGWSPPGLWLAIGLSILVAVILVVLFGLLIYSFTYGAQQLGFASTGYVAVFMLISGVFAWLLKRLSDAASDWFGEESDQLDKLE